ncbi:MAG: FkbM family methyltransferase [Gallionella sp.]
MMNIPVSDAVLGPSLRLYGEWAQDEIEGLSMLLKDGDVVIDAGANIGTHSLGFASAISPTGRVYSFEPQVEVFELLRQNCNGNVHASNIVPFCHPLSSVNGRKFSIPLLDDVSIHNFGATQLSTLKIDDVSYESSESMTIDGLNLDSCRLIKLDVEGMELEVLKGAVSLIRKCKPLIFFEANTILETWEVIQQIAPWGGYSVRVVISNAFSSKNFNNNQNNIFSDFQETSILLYPEQEDTLVCKAFCDSIPISNYSELTIALAILCHRPSGHPLSEFSTKKDDVEKIYRQKFDGLNKSILRELVYQKKVRFQESATLSQENATLSQENAALSQGNAALSQGNATLSQENATLRQEVSSLLNTNRALLDHLQTYQNFPPIWLMRKIRAVFASIFHRGKC